MQYFILLACCTVVRAGLVSHGFGDHGATSYQNIHIEHFHPVPVYIKHEDKPFLDNPIPIGKSSSKVEINHGHKHNFAVTNVVNDVPAAHGYSDDSETQLDYSGGHEEEAAALDHHGGQSSAALEGHEAVTPVHEQGDDYAPYEGQQFALGHGYEGANLGHYHLVDISAGEGYAADAGQQEAHYPSYD